MVVTVKYSNLASICCHLAQVKCTIYKNFLTFGVGKMYNVQELCDLLYSSYLLSLGAGKTFERITIDSFLFCEKKTLFAKMH